MTESNIKDFKKEDKIEELAALAEILFNIRGIFKR